MNRRQQRAFNLLMWIMGLCLVGFIAGRPLYWHLSEGFTAAVRHDAFPSCPPCRCDCSLQPLLSLTDDSANLTRCLCPFFNCRIEQQLYYGLHETRSTGSEDMEKGFLDLLSEEVKLKEDQALGKQRRADMAILEAKKIASQYQKDADKCNSGMETCEEAREKAEAALEAQRKVTAMWELRARQRGWNSQ